MRSWLAWIAVGWALVVMLVGSAGYGAPYDLVPQGDWSYDLLARWAAQGLVTVGRGYSAREFHGDEPRTRAEMADLIIPLAQHPEALPPGEVVFLEQLLREFAQEIRLARQDPSALIRAAEAERKSRPKDDASWVARGTGFGMVRAGDSSSDGGAVRGVYRTAGLVSITSRLMVATSLTNDRQLSSDNPNAFPILEHYLVRWHTGFADWELGKTSNRWGPGFGGTMLLSDNAPALFQLNGKKTFSLGFLGHTYTFEQFAATLNEPGGRRYVVARRLSRPFGRRAGVSISEAIKSSSTRDFPLALILPLYVYNHTVFTDQEKAETVNYLASGDIWYAPSRAVQLYGDLVIDDITTPFGLGYSVPRKIGFLLGLHFPGMNRRRTDVRLEWALTDGEKPGSTLHEGGTYIHRNPTLSWYIDGLPIGHPMGTNRRGPFVRVQHRFGRRLTTIGEWEDERQWRVTPLVGDRRRAMLYTAYDLRPNRSVGIRVERTGGALGRDTLGEVQASYSF